MTAIRNMRGPISWMRQMLNSYKSLRIKEPNTNEPVAAVAKKPTPQEIASKKQGPSYDQLTHTGQAWDEADYRLARFEFSQKQVNPNIAAHLVAEQAPVASEDHVVFCDGGHRHGGHPKVFINLDKPGTHACGYCGQRFFNVHATKTEDMKNAHIQFKKCIKMSDAERERQQMSDAERERQRLLQIHQQLDDFREAVRRQREALERMEANVERLRNERIRREEQKREWDRRRYRRGGQQ